MQHTFLYISLPSLHVTVYDVKFPQATFVEDVNKKERTYLSPLKLGFGLQEFNSRKIHLYYTFSANRNKGLVKKYGGGGGWAGAFGNVVDKKHMAHPLRSAKK